MCSEILWLTPPFSPQQKPQSEESSKMADNLKMNGLSINDAQNGPSHPGGRSAYIPPHLRNQPRGPGPAPVPGPPPMGYDGAGPPPGPGAPGSGAPPAGAWGPGYEDSCFSFPPKVFVQSRTGY